MLIFTRNSEGGEDHRHHEEVIERKALFDDVNRVVIHCALGSKIVPDNQAIRKTSGNVPGAQDQAVAKADDVIIAFAEQAEVKNK